jgi:hypothetical protein
MSPDRTTQFPLRLPKTLREAAKQLAEREGVTLNHFISLALAEKVSRVQHQANNSDSIRPAKIVLADEPPVV